MHIVETDNVHLRLQELIKQSGGLQQFVDELVSATIGDDSPRSMCALADGLRSLGFCVCDRRRAGHPRDYSLRTRC